MNLLLSFESEYLKTRKTSLIFLCVIISFFVPLILFCENFFDQNAVKKLILDPWFRFYVNGQRFTNILFLPLFTLLTSTLLFQLEFRNNTLKQLFASPQSRFNILLSKFILLQLLIIGFLTCYNLWLVFVAVSLQQLSSETLSLTGVLDLKELWLVNGQSYFAIFGVSGIQFWLSSRFKNFIMPIMIGFILWFIAATIMFEMKLKYGCYFPHSIPIVIAFPKWAHKTVLLQAISVGYGCFFFLLSYAELRLKKSTV